MKEIIVIGGGGHAKVVISILKKIREYNIIGYTDINNRGKILGVSHYGNDEKLLNIEHKPFLALGIGLIRNFAIRKKIVDKFIEKEFVFEAIISPNATINEEVNLDNGTVVMDGVVINSGTTIGKYSIVNTNSSIDHDCKIGDFVHIAPGVTVSGGVVIGNMNLIGIASTILQSIIIGDFNIIGAGSVINENIPSGVVAFGNPCKVIKENI